MRGERYVYSSGDTLEWHGPEGAISIPMDVMDEYVVMRLARMSDAEIGEAALRAYDNHVGNFGFDGLAKMLDLPTIIDQLHEVAVGLGTENGVQE